MSVKISTETNITSVLQTLQNIRGSTYWECENYYNLYWNKDTNELKVCGFQGESSYEIIKRCPFLNVKEYDILSEERLIAYLSDGFRIILPISTKGIGMEGADYFHNVFVSELINQKTVKIYDFWRPKFKWDFREIKICDAIKGICVSAETNQRIIIFSPLQTKKENKYINDENIIKDYLYANADNVGINAITCLEKHIANLEDVYYLNHVNFIALLEHFNVWKEWMQLFSMDLKLINSIILSANKLKILSMKYWYAKSVQSDWKEILMKQLNMLISQEELLLQSIINEDMRNLEQEMYKK